MNQPNASHPITVTNLSADLLPLRTNASLGNANVLSSLLPRLAQVNIRPAKCERRLHQVDAFMLDEIEQIGQLLQNYATQLACVPTEGLELRRTCSGLVVYRANKVHSALSQRINADPWLIETFNWLESSLVTLAQSLAILEFSKHYRQNSNDPLAEYNHLSQDCSKLRFSIAVCSDNIKAKLESPFNLFIVL